MRAHFTRTPDARTGRHKRRAGFLLTYWVAVLLFGILQSCCASAADVLVPDHADIFGAVPGVNEHGSRHFYCQGLDALHNATLIASPVVNFGDDNEQKPPVLASSNTLDRAGDAIAAYRGDGPANDLATFSPPIYLTTLRLRL
jgi:hypothetical protein